MDYNIDWAEEEGAWVAAWEAEEPHINTFDQTDQTEAQKETARMSHQDDTYQTVVAGVEDVIITGAHMLQFDYRQEYRDGSVHEARIFMHPSQMTAFVEKIAAALEARERFLAALDQEAQ